MNNADSVQPTPRYGDLSPWGGLCNGQRSHRLVITAALKAELPQQWLKELGYPIWTTNSLKSSWSKEGLGASPTAPTGASGGGVLFVVTGVGPQASQQAAKLICEELNPGFVVNVGTAGIIDEGLSRGTWLAPSWVTDLSGERYSLPDTFPFSMSSDSVPVIRGDGCLTLANPLVGGVDGPSLPIDVARSPGQGPQIVDMECCAQAAVFAASHVPFGVLKLTSDDGGAQAVHQHRQTLRRMRAELEDLLSFLDRPCPPHVAVVIPVYNRAHTMVSCLLSVLGQTLVPKEVLVVDDGSGDALMDELRPFADRVKVLRLPKNVGVSQARNMGVAATQSPWICFLDSDDLWIKDKLESQWAFHRHHPHLRISQTQEIWIRRGKRVNACRHHQKPMGWIWHHCLQRCMITPSAVMMDRQLFIHHQGFDPRFRVCEDYDLWLRISRSHPVGLVDVPGVVKRGGHEDQLSAAYPAMDRFRVAALWKELCEERDLDHRHHLRRQILQRLQMLSQGAQKRGKDEEACLYRNLAQLLDQGLT